MTDTHTTQAIRLDLTPGALYRCTLPLGRRGGHLYRVHGAACGT